MKSFVLTLMACLLLTTNAVAWDDIGHMTVAASAYDQLTPSAKKQVAALLKLNPKYSTWVVGVAAKDRDKIAFMRAAVWADDIKKSGSGYTMDGTENGNRPSGPNAARNIG